MLSNPQKALIKTAQRQAQIPDADYRAALMEVVGTDTSTDEKLTNRHWDLIMSYLEAIYWHAVDQHRLAHRPRPRDPFQRRDFWRSRNTTAETSRDRFNHQGLAAEINHLEDQCRLHGCAQPYLDTIRRNTRTPINYRAALKRTLAAKQKKQAQAQPLESNCPF